MIIRYCAECKHCWRSVWSWEDARCLVGERSYVNPRGRDTYHYCSNMNTRGACEFFEQRQPWWLLWGLLGTYEEVEE